MALTMVANMISGLRLSTAVKALAGLALFAQSTCAHTWIEQMQVIGPNGSYIGDYGYPRGYMARTDKGYNGESDKYQLPPTDGSGHTRITDQMLLCHPSQRTANYSSEYPKLQVAPGSYVAMKYTENGHVTQPWLPEGKPEHGGTVWVFGTYQPSATEKLANVLKWTTDGKGGDGKGWMMTAQTFDDGRCYQINSNLISIDRQIKHGDHVKDQPTSQIEQWCETDLRVPTDVKVGSTLTTYWVWSWDTAPHTNGTACGKDEYYITCSDFDVVDGGDNLEKLASVPVQHTLEQQDPQSTAVSNYQSRTALTPTPIIVPQSCTIAATAVTSSSWAASITLPTSLPATMPTTFVKYPAMPTYNPMDKQSAAAPAPQQSATSSSSSSPITGTQSSTAGTMGTYTNSSTPAAAASSTSASSSNSTVTVTSTSMTTATTATQSIQFLTVTITAAPSGAAPAASASTQSNVAAAAVVDKNGRVEELGKRSHPRGGWRLAA